MSRLKKAVRDNDRQQIGVGGLEFSRMYTEHSGEDYDAIQVEIISRGEREGLDPVFLYPDDFEYDRDVLII